MAGTAKIIIFSWPTCTVLWLKHATKNGFDLPGGRCNAGESLLDAARREGAEELGAPFLEAAAGRALIETFSRRQPRPLQLYTLVVDAPFTPILQPREHKDFLWQPLAEGFAPKIVLPSLRPIVPPARQAFCHLRLRTAQLNKPPRATVGSGLYRA